MEISCLPSPSIPCPQRIRAHSGLKPKQRSRVEGAHCQERRIRRRSPNDCYPSMVQGQGQQRTRSSFNSALNSPDAHCSGLRTTSESRSTSGLRMTSGLRRAGALSGRSCRKVQGKAEPGGECVWRLTAGSFDAASVGDASDSPAEAPASGGIGGAWQLGLLLAAIGVTTAACAAAAGQGPSGFVSALSKSGFAAAFSLIFVSEIGDKTFFIAALLAMRHSKSIVLAGSVSALGLMSVISAVIGRLFREVPSQLKTSIPIGEYAACALLIYFGVTSIKNALALPSAPSPAVSGASAATGDGGPASGVPAEGEEEGELAEAREFVEQATAKKEVTTTMAAFWETFSIVFLAEWGDRSMLATVALGAAQSPAGVALGATWGHLLATAIAVLGGAFLSQYISERTVGLTGGILFLAFAAATLLGFA